MVCYWVNDLIYDAGRLDGGIGLWGRSYCVANVRILCCGM